jgi:hypothetical protein
MKGRKMLELVKLAMTINGALAGYKTYLGAFFMFIAALGGWGVDVFMPFLDGGMDITTLVGSSSPYFAAMGGAFGFAGLRKAT